ncbi:putative glycosyl transferase [Carnobacterium sp. 17-4]|uniref:glycosyltransferase n=1 Tax=Carnobacterium sp. (strain 17-4) TaxID=208596 RepID=UPI0002058EC0|nr:glycosyltransferase [Carnobacterium sp. 17-4]AEB30228.1 putative glycosyl transferase [Carnobacterium sp. 17-4]
MKKVSIIMPIYNVAEQLEKAIQCALNQTYNNSEIILVNDGSTDASGEICDRYQLKDPRISVIHQKNAGSGFARNAGLDRATGEYIYFADPDDYFETNLIEETVGKAIESNVDVVVCGYYDERVDKEGHITTIEKKLELNGLLTKEAFKDQFRKHFSLSPYALWNKLYKHDFLKRHNCRFTNQKVGQDALFNQQVGMNVQTIYYHQKAYYHYVFREGSAVNRYRKERFFYEYTIARHFEDWMVYWDKEKEYRDLVNQHYWGALYLELSNLSWEDCPLAWTEKAERIEELMDDSKINQAISEIETEKEKNSFVRILILLMRNEKYSGALKVMQLRVTVGKKFQKSFNVIKRIFS